MDVLVDLFDSDDLALLLRYIRHCRRSDRGTLKDGRM